MVALYLATELRAVPHDPQGIEEQSMTIERVPLAEAMADIDAGRITDAKTMIGLLTVGATPGVIELEVVPREVEDLLIWLAAERGRSPRTIEAYRRDLRRYAAWLGERGRTALDATEDDVVAHVGGAR